LRSKKVSSAFAFALALTLTLVAFPFLLRSKKVASAFAFAFAFALTRHLLPEQHEGSGTTMNLGLTRLKNNEKSEGDS
jgi:hypothetical protein